MYVGLSVTPYCYWYCHQCCHCRQLLLMLFLMATITLIDNAKKKAVFGCWAGAS